MDPNLYLEDEQLARDLQMALDMQAIEEVALSRQQRNHESKRSKKEWKTENGYADRRELMRPGGMLFVACEIDGRLVQLFVDSGAGCSVMTLAAVHRLHLQHKMSRDFSGVAGGVGSANIVGVVENVQCTIGHVEFLLYFVVLDTPSLQIILGLDQLKRFRCLIDLEEKMLIFGGKNGVSVPFLPDDLAAEAAEVMAGNVELPPAHQHRSQSSERNSAKKSGILPFFGKKK